MSNKPDERGLIADTRISVLAYWCCAYSVLNKSGYRVTECGLNMCYLIVQLAPNLPTMFVLFTLYSSMK